MGDHFSSSLPIHRPVRSPSPGTGSTLRREPGGAAEGLTFRERMKPSPHLLIVLPLTVLLAAASPPPAPLAPSSGYSLIRIAMSGSDAARQAAARKLAAA